MAHVGELSAFPSFANAVAKAIHDFSEGKVKCVLYTRHNNAKLLDTDLFIINFSLDASSLNRQDWAPENSRVVYSAWDGEVHRNASVNFLEHHFLHHTQQVGEGEVCPATLPETPERSCDAVQCDLCFRSVSSFT